MSHLRHTETTVITPIFRLLLGELLLLLIFMFTVTLSNSIFIVFLIIIMLTWFWSKMKITIDEECVKINFGFGIVVQNIAIENIQKTKKIDTYVAPLFGIKKNADGWTYTDTRLPLVELHLIDKQTIRFSSAHAEKIIAYCTSVEMDAQ